MFSGVLQVHRGNVRHVPPVVNREDPVADEHVGYIHRLGPYPAQAGEKLISANNFHIILYKLFGQSRGRLR